MFSFRPATLHKVADRWQIVFFTEPPESPGRWRRHRETWDLNRVKSILEREKMAKRIIKRLNDELLPAGYPHKSIAQIEKPSMSCRAAWDFSIDIKCRTPYKESVRTYKGIWSVFNQYLDAYKISDLPVQSFSKKHVTDFSDYITLTREVKGRTHNKYMMHIHCAWQELCKRELVEKNVWSKAPRLEEVEVERRCFTEEERTVVASYVYHNDRWLFYWILLEYYCFIRGEELKRLRFRDVYIKEGYIYLAATKTKNKKEAYLTIPEDKIHYFTDDFFSRHDLNLLIFGKDFLPHQSIAVGKNTPNSRHRNILMKLQKENLLNDISNLSLYSWKYSGITDHLLLKVLSIDEIQSQARHATPQQSMVYVRRPRVNLHIRASKLKFF